MSEKRLEISLGKRRYCCYRDARGFACSNEIQPREDMSISLPRNIYCAVHTDRVGPIFKKWSGYSI